MNEESKDPVCHRGPKDTTLEPPKPEDTLLCYTHQKESGYNRNTRTINNNLVLTLL